MLIHCLDDTASWLYHTSVFQIFSMIVIIIPDHRHTNEIISSLHRDRKWILKVLLLKPAQFSRSIISLRLIFSTQTIFWILLSALQIALPKYQSSLINPLSSLKGQIFLLRHLLQWMSLIVHSKPHNPWVITPYQLTMSHTHVKHGPKRNHQDVSNVPFSQSSPKKCSQTYI